MKKYRLCYCTGSFSASLTAGYISTKKDNYINICLFTSYTADIKYIKNTTNFIKALGCFDSVLCANFCIYKNSNEDGVMHISAENLLLENDDNTKIFRLNNLLNDIIIEEIISVHYLSPFTNLLARQYQNADIYTIEEGLNSYFRKYKSKLSEDDLYFIKRWRGHISYNWLGIETLFDFNKFGIKNIILKKEIIQHIINLAKKNLNVDFIFKKNSVLIVGQIPRFISENDLFVLYEKIINEILQRNITIYFAKHPRDISSLESRIINKFKNKVNIIDNEYGMIEIFIEKNLKMVIGHSSTSLLTIQHIFNIPCVLIENINLNKICTIKGDMMHSKIFCSCVLPHFNYVFQNNVRLDAIVKKHDKFIKNIGLIRAIYKNIYIKNNNNLYSGYYLFCKSINEYNNNNINKSWEYALKSIKFKCTRISTHLFIIKILTRKIKLFFSIPIIKKFNENDLIEHPYSESILEKYIYYLIYKKDLTKAKIYNSYLFHINRFRLRTYKNYIVLIILNLYQKVKDSHGSIVSLLMYFIIFQLVIKSKIAKKESEASDILSITYRPNRGPTGGPGGVLFLESEILGTKIDIYNHDILFRRGENYFDLFADIFSAALWTNDLIANKSHNLYITHDMGVAFMLALLNKKYMLIWHFQGPFITQYENWGIQMNSFFKSVIRYIEKISLKKAQSVYFPSIGAKEMYEKDANRGYKLSLESLPPLYNTLLDESDNVCCESIIFISVGTQTQAKGQDNIIIFFDKYLMHTSKNIIWYNIGDGVLYDSIAADIKTLEEKYCNFKGYLIKKLNHEKVLELLEKSDAYIMLHRISIFDFATLEAMSKKCAIILSRIGGNLEFNRENNIIYDDEFDFKIFETNLENFKYKNFYCYKKYFSPKNFKNSYSSEIIKNMHMINNS